MCTCMNVLLTITTVFGEIQYKIKSPFTTLQNWIQFNSHFAQVLCSYNISIGETYKSSCIPILWRWIERGEFNVIDQRDYTKHEHTLFYVSPLCIRTQWQHLYASSEERRSSCLNEWINEWSYYHFIHFNAWVRFHYSYFSL